MNLTGERRGRRRGLGSGFPLWSFGQIFHDICHIELPFLIR